MKRCTEKKSHGLQGVAVLLCLQADLREIEEWNSEPLGFWLVT